ncbi:MAG TPA: tyrosine-type recombinase/integrase [Cytophagales bacterium]|nr:tyrosine-type recombinase/integrase [Cytophagales bacterium]
MATYKVVWRKQNKNKIGQSPVYVQYGHNERTTLFNTTVKVELEYFSPKPPFINRVRSVKKIKANELLVETLKNQDLTDNNTIAIKESTIKQAVQTQLINKGIDPTIERVRALFKPGAGPDDPEPSKKKIIALYDEFVENEVDVRASSKKHFTVTKNHIESYIKAIKKPEADSSVLTFDFINGFNKYLIKEKKQSPVTANNHIKRIKRFATWIIEGKKKTAKDVNLNKDNTVNQKKIFLEADELLKLYNYDLKGNTRLERVRDLFCFSCCTGLRYSDGQAITNYHIQKDLITITNLKNNKTVEIPLFLFAKEILKKYNGDLPKISNQKMNEYLKDLFKEVGFNESIIIPQWRGKERAPDVVFKKYDLLSSHSAKKTFCMLAVDNDMPIETLAAITGNDEKTLKHYYEIRPEKKRKHLLAIEQSIMKVS